MKRFDRLSQLHIQKPCSADWNEMSGDEAKRYCGHCRKNVHNLSELPAEEAEKLRGCGSVCVRYKSDNLGRIITKTALIATVAVAGVGCVAPSHAEVVGAIEPSHNQDQPVMGEIQSQTPPGDDLIQGQAPTTMMGNAPAEINLGRISSPDSNGDSQAAKTK